MRSLVLLPLFILAACSARGPEQVVISGQTMGTQFTVKLIGDVAAINKSGIDEEIGSILRDVEMMMSTYIEDADISQFNATDTRDWHHVSREFCDAIEHALELSVVTNGAFDITAGPLVNLWGFGPPETSFEPPSAEDIDAAKASVGYQHLHTDCEIPAIRRDLAGLQIDLSAYGKGYGVDRLAEAVEASGFDDYLVEVGGELRVGGQNSDGEDWSIGIEIPRAGVREPYTVVMLSDLAVATSGDYRNFFEHEGIRYSHEIDTQTGMPVTHKLAAVSIIDESAATADAIATGLLVLGPEEGFALASQEGIAALFLSRTEGGIEERVSPMFETLKRKL